MGVISMVVLCQIKGIYLSIKRPSSTKDTKAHIHKFDKKVSNAKEYLAKAFQGIAAHMIISTSYKIRHPKSEIYMDRWIATIVHALGGDVSELGSAFNKRPDIADATPPIRVMFEIKQGLTKDSYDEEQLKKGIEELKWYLDQVNKGNIAGGTFGPGSGEKGEVMIDSKTRLRWDTPGGKGVILYIFEHMSNNGWETLSSNVNESIELMRKAMEMKYANSLPSSSFDPASDPGAPVASVAPNPGGAPDYGKWIRVVAAAGAAYKVCKVISEAAADRGWSLAKNAGTAIAEGAALPCVPDRILHRGSYRPAA